jgi:hypothetical protein
LVTPDERAGAGNPVAGPTAIPLALPFPLITSTNTGPSPNPFPLTVCRDGAIYPDGTWVTLYFDGKAMDQGLTDYNGRLDILGAEANDELRVVSLDGALSGAMFVPPDPPGDCLELNPVARTTLVGDVDPYLRLWPTTGGGLLDGLRLVVERTLPDDNLVYSLTGPDNIGPSNTLPYNTDENDHRIEVSFIPAALSGHAKVLGAHAGRTVNVNVDYRLQQASSFSDTNLYSNDGNFRLHLDAGSLPADTYFLIASPWGLPGSLPSGLDIIGEAYEITASGSLTSLDRPAVLRLHYDATAGSTFEGLAIYRWDANAETWLSLGGEIDPEQQDVAVSTTGLGIYALLGKPANFNIYLPLIISL